MKRRSLSKATAYAVLPVSLPPEDDHLVVLLVGLDAAGVHDAVSALAYPVFGLLEDLRRRRRDVLGSGLDGYHAPFRAEAVHVVAGDVSLPLLGDVLIDDSGPFGEHGVLLGLGGVSQHRHHARPALAVADQLSEHPRSELHADHAPVANDVRHMGGGGPAGRSQIEHARSALYGHAHPPARDVGGELAPARIPLAKLFSVRAYQALPVDPPAGTQGLGVEPAPVLEHTFDALRPHVYSQEGQLLMDFPHPFRLEGYFPKRRRHAYSEGVSSRSIGTPVVRSTVAGCRFRKRWAMASKDVDDIGSGSISANTEGER